MNKTVLPLNPTDMVEFFKDKNKEFLIDYKKSKEVMSPKSILVYLSNLQIKCEFDEIDGELVEAYLFIKDLCNVPVLDLFVANLIYFNKYNIPFIDTETFASFGEEVLASNKEIVDFYTEVMESSSLFILSKRFPELKGVKGELPNKIGFCFLNLYKIPDFLLAFSETMKPLDEQVMFDEIFDNDNYLFKGKNVFSYFVNDNNLFYQYLENLTRMMNLSEEVNEENVDALNRMVEIHDIINE